MHKESLCIPHVLAASFYFYRVSAVASWDELSLLAEETLPLAKSSALHLLRKTVHWALAGAWIMWIHSQLCHWHSGDIYLADYPAKIRSPMSKAPFAFMEVCQPAPAGDLALAVQVWLWYLSLSAKFAWQYYENKFSCLILIFPALHWVGNTTKADVFVAAFALTF